MNAKTKSATRQASNQGGGNGATPATQQGALVPTTPKPKEEAPLVENQTCLNPNCKVVVTEENYYARHGNRKTCCQPCDDIVDPVSAEFRRQRSRLFPPLFTPLVDGIDQPIRQNNQVQTEF